MSESVIIKGTGAYVPQKAVSNFELAQRVDTSDEWIRTRTGIANRHIASQDETPSFMGAQAAAMAIKNARLSNEDIDCIVVATVTPDMPFPSTAALIQAKLGVRPVMAFDVEAACSGFLYALDVGVSLLKGKKNYRNALVVGTEKLSTLTDWEDRSTCVLFGDGAGAVVLSKTTEKNVGILETNLGADGNFTHLLSVPAGGSACPPSPETIAGRKHYIKMNGREVFKIAVRYMEQVIHNVLEKTQVQTNAINLVVPHQANQRIIEALAERLPVPMERVFCNIEEFGNTSAASIPIALWQAHSQGRIQKGDYVLFVAFGAGLSWGASLVKWA